MKILHTSDWHLGQHFFGKTREREHQQFLQWLLVQIKQQQIDIVIVAGDIFDTGTPPSYARHQFNQFIVAMHKLDCQLIVVAGNHDSVAMLNESKHLVAELNAIVVAGVTEHIEEQVVVVKDKTQNPIAVICLIPFLRPRDVTSSETNDLAIDKQQRLISAIAAHYEAAFQFAIKSASVNIPIIATGHLTTVGASVSDSVRDIYIGTLDAFPADLFPPVDYIALGHIHRRQKVGKSEHIWYCGSPIPLSFDELSQDKSVNVVSFNEKKLISIEQVIIPRFQNIQVIRGNVASIISSLKALVEKQTTPESIWLAIEVVSQEYISDIQQKIEQIIEPSSIEVLSIKRRNASSTVILANEDVKQELAELSVDDVFIQRLAQDDCDGLTDDEKDKMLTLYQQSVIKFQHVLDEQTYLPKVGQ